MERHEPESPSPPFFEFNSADTTLVRVFDKPTHIHQEPPELEEYGPDHVFDSRGRLAELGVEDFGVVAKRWSEPDLDQFERYLHRAATRFLKGDDVSALSTVELRDRLEPVLRQWQREHMPFWPVERLARKVWKSVSRRSG